MFPNCNTRCDLVWPCYPSGGLRCPAAAPPARGPLHDEAGVPFIECYVEVDLAIAEERDPKGLYKKARAGEIKGFTGIDDPYEAPANAELVLNTGEQSLEACVAAALEAIEARGLLG